MATRREPDAYMPPAHIRAGAWMERYGDLIRARRDAQPKNGVVHLITTQGPVRLNPRQEYAVWFIQPDVHEPDPNCPF